MKRAILIMIVLAMGLFAMAQGAAKNKYGLIIPGSPGYGHDVSGPDSTFALMTNTAAQALGPNGPTKWVKIPRGTASLKYYIYVGDCDADSLQTYARTSADGINAVPIDSQVHAAADVPYIRGHKFALTDSVSAGSMMEYFQLFVRSHMNTTASTAELLSGTAVIYFLDGQGAIIDKVYRAWDHRTQ
jgi:hypothetical protein